MSNVKQDTLITYQQSHLTSISFQAILIIFKFTFIVYIEFYHHVCPINCITASSCRTYLNIKERAVRLLSKYTSHNLHRAEQSTPAIPAKENCATMSHPNKNTLPQYNSVARCKIFAIKNCTILTYAAPFCTIPGQKLL